MKATRGFFVCFLVYALCGLTTGAELPTKATTEPEKTFASNVEPKPDATTLKPTDASPQKPTDAPAEKANTVPGQKPSELPPTPVPSQPPTAVPNNSTPTSATVKPTPGADPSTTVPTKPTPVPTTVVPPATPPSSTLAPATTVKPVISTVQPLVPPTNTPRSRFDGPSFVGGIVLTFGLVAMGFIGFKYYKARTDRNYHTL